MRIHPTVNYVTINHKVVGTRRAASSYYISYVISYGF